MIAPADPTATTYSANPNLPSNDQANMGEDQVRNNAPEDDHGAVLQVVPHLESGPIGRFAADLAMTVQRLGGDSKMISSGGRFAQEVMRAGVTHQTLDIDSTGLFGIGGPSSKLSSWIGKWRTRMVHSHGAEAAAQTRKAISKKPVHHVASLYRLPGNDKASDAGTKAILSANRVIVASEFLADLLVKGNPVAREKISVVQPGMAIQAVHPSVVTAARLTRLVKKVIIPTDAPLILFPAAIQPNAGHEILLDVLQSMTDVAWNCVFATIGPGNKKVRQQLQAKIDRMGFQNKVRFVDNCDDPATLYKLSAVVVSSVMGNLAFDYAAAEAQSAGKLVLVPNTGASPHQVTAGTDGAVFEAADTETIEMALRWALTLPADQRAAIEHAATARAYKTYKKDEAVKRIFSVYDELLA